MPRHKKTWSELKSLAAAKVAVLQYEDQTDQYRVWFSENGDSYFTFIDIPSADATDFDDNYKASANDPLHPVDSDGKVYSRAESRPLGYTTVFAMCGDKTSAPQEIGGGKLLSWDFSNSDDEITAPTNYKRKRMEFSFIDAIHVKEGTFYFYNAPKGSYIDFYIVCPDGQYYKKNDGTLAQASGDTPIVHYVVCHQIQGDCPMGDELNTEAASSAVPSNYKFWLEVTTPNTDTTSNGHASIEIYRERTVILT